MPKLRKCESIGRTDEVKWVNLESWFVLDADWFCYIRKATRACALDGERKARSNGDFDQRHVGKSNFVNLGDPVLCLKNSGILRYKPWSERAGSQTSP